MNKKLSGDAPAYKLRVEALREGREVKGGVNPTTTQIPQRPAPPPALKPALTQPASPAMGQKKPGSGLR